MKNGLYEQLLKAYNDGDDDKMRDLMEGYSPAKMVVAYRLVESIEGYAAKCAAKRGEHTYVGRMLGICE